MKTKTLTLEIREDGQVHLAGTATGFYGHTRGYQTVQFKLHHLVALAFHGPPPAEMAKPVVHHKDSDPRNNHADNLEWLSQAENTRRHYTGRPRLLAAKDVETIRLMKPPASITLKELAASFGVSVSAVRAVRSGRTFSGKSPSNRAILTPDQIRVIREWSAAKPTAVQVSRMYKVSKTVILSIWNGRY